jgi:hypothetical protein
LISVAYYSAVLSLNIVIIILSCFSFMAVNNATYSQESPNSDTADPLLRGLPDLPDFSSGNEPNLSSLFPRLNISDASSPEPDPRSPVVKVSGTYKNDKVGFQISLPSGWSGEELKFLVHMVIISPEGYQFESEGVRPDTIITVSGIDAAAFQELANLAQNDGQDILGFSNERVSCKILSSSPANINGIPADEVMEECNDEGIMAKGKGYVFGTLDNSFIALGFYSTSAEAYDQYLPLFEESVKTLKISEPGDISRSEAYNKFKVDVTNMTN